MVSIYTASKLVKRPGGIIFVDDTDRELELECCKTFLSDTVLVDRVTGWANLDKYIIR